MRQLVIRGIFYGAVAGLLIGVLVKFLVPIMPYVIGGGIIGGVGIWAWHKARQSKVEK